MIDLLLDNFNVHDHLKGKSVEELRAINTEDRLPYAVAVINLTGSLNIGIIIRTACLMGAERVIVFGRRKYDVRSCVGSHNYIPVERIDGFVDDIIPDPPLDAVKFRTTMEHFNYIPLFIETGGYELNRLELLGGHRYAAKKNKKLCLVLGSEGEGIPEDILSQGIVYSIPQLGVIRSYNVSSAASIALWELYNAIKNENESN